MPKMSGALKKLHSSISETVQYSLPLDDEMLPLNPLIGSVLTLKFDGRISCANCGRKTRKSFNQGYCFPCSQKLARCDMCIVRPERCHHHEGTCREPDWGEANCMQPHVVYLANSSGLKVGITRASQIPTRWVDQGASQALPILRVDSRLQSGLIEVALAEHVADKTNWRTLLKSEPEPLDLAAERDRLLALCKEKLDELRAGFGDGAVAEVTDSAATDIRYPVDAYPEKVSSLNLDKTPEITAELRGIKGQYLILDCGVLNVRKFTSYHVTVSH